MSYVKNDHKIQLVYLFLFVLIVFGNRLFGQNIFVSPEGNDANPGTISSPKHSVQSAAQLLQPGDTLFFREGNYHQAVSLKDIAGSASAPLVFKSYKEENAVMDGTVNLKEIAVPGSSWKLASDSFPGTQNIYMLPLEEDIWQLWVKLPGLMHVPNAVGGELAGYRMQVIARWPNGKTNPCDPLQQIPGSTDAMPNTWWSMKTTWAFGSDPGTNHTQLVNSPDRFNLAATGKSFTHGTLVLSIIKQGPANFPVGIIEHNAGSDVIKHTGFDEDYDIYNYPSDLGPSYFIQHLKALDSPGEWYYDKESKTVYLWPEDNSDPNLLEVRGKTQSYAFDLQNCAYIEFGGIGLFGTSLRLDGTNITFQNGAISYPDMPRSLLGEYGFVLPAIDARDCKYFTMENCVVEYSQSHVIEVKNVGGVFINNYFHHLGMTGYGASGCFLNVNTFLYNTLKTVGNRAAVKCNSSPDSGRIQSWNILDGWGYLYSNDGVGFQSSQGGSVNSVRAYNWFLNSDKSGHRYDGPEEGLGFPTLGLSHHLVGYKTKSASTTIKGDYNQVYNYEAIDCTSEYGGIVIRWNLNTGEGNAHTIMRNCVSNGINLGKWDPLPCIQSNNWDSSKKEGSLHDFYPGTDVFDFRPRAGAPMVNRGYAVEGITDGYLGSAPDIGAYEWGDNTYWIPGYRPDTISMPIPYNGATEQSLDRDLMFRHAYQSEQAVVYMGRNSELVKSADLLSSAAAGETDIDKGGVVRVILDSGNNIVTPTMLYGNPNHYDPSPYLLVDDPEVVLRPNTTYYWRVDAVDHHSEMIKKGPVWGFTTGEQTFLVKAQVFMKKEGVVSPVFEAVAEVADNSFITDSTGEIYGARLLPDQYKYSFHKKGYTSAKGSFTLQSDTLITDTLAYENYHVGIQVLDTDLQVPVSGISVQLGQYQLETNESGYADISDVEYNHYVLFAESDEYITGNPIEVEIWTDTLFTIYLKRDYKNGVFIVTDKYKNVPVEGALITSPQGESVITNAEGQASLGRMSPGWSSFKVTHTDYFTFLDSVYVDKDTIRNKVELEQNKANVTMLVLDENVPVANAEIHFDDFFAETTVDGMTWFFFLPAREQYAFMVEKEAYQRFADTMFLTTDTTIEVFLKTQTSVGSSLSENIKIYPNPVRNFINLTGLKGFHNLFLIDEGGRVILEQEIESEACTIKVSSLASGIYSIQLLGTERIMQYRISKI